MGLTHIKRPVVEVFKQIKRQRSMVIVQILGGLGNQLFAYCAARRLALKNTVPLKLDIISGFKRDYYKRNYGLQNFNINAGIASRYESYDSFCGRGRRYLARKISRLLPFNKRRYITEESPQFDRRLLDLKISGVVYMEGYWQSELYFKDIENELRDELQFRGPHSQVNIEMAKNIQNSQSVCIHVRRLHGIPKMSKAALLDHKDLPANFVGSDYYNKAVRVLVEKVRNPHFFVFSDYPEWARNNLRFDYSTTFVDHNDSDRDYEDLWLMSGCKYFIIGNSTFSWWGAWLSSFKNKVVIAPSKGLANNIDIMPNSWIII